MIKPVSLKEVEQTSDHFTEMLETIQNNKHHDSHLQGLRDCRWLFETWIAQLHKENKELKEKLSLYEWRDIPDDHVFPTGRYLIEIVDEDGPLVHLMEVEQSFTAIGGCLSFDMPGKRTRYMALPTPPTQEGEE